MPNIIIETSRDGLITKPENLLARVNDTLWESGQFKKPEDIKARIYTPTHALVGLAGGSHQAFIVVHFYLMPGRDDVTLQSLAQRIADAIQAYIKEFESIADTGNLQICVNPTELSKQYIKQVI